MHTVYDGRMNEPMRAAPPTAWWKTSLRLRDFVRARYEASGRSLPALVEKGLDAFEAEAMGTVTGPDPVNLIMAEVERALRASLNNYGMIAWPGLPEGVPPEMLPQPRTGPVKMRRIGRRPTRRYAPAPLADDPDTIARRAEARADLLERSARDPGDHGTASGWAAHRKYGEKPCAVCQQSHDDGFIEQP